MKNNNELIEYFWNESENISYFWYENTYTGVLETFSRPAKLDPEIWLGDKSKTLRDKYFAELKTWLKTQDGGSK